LLQKLAGIFDAIPQCFFIRVRPVEIRPYLVQNKTDSGTRSFSADRAQAQKQCLDLAPFNIAVNWLCEDRFNLNYSRIL
jgi:hypothetical protein